MDSISRHDTTKKKNKANKTRFRLEVIPIVSSGLSIGPSESFNFYRFWSLCYKLHFRWRQNKGYYHLLRSKGGILRLRRQIVGCYCKKQFKWLDYFLLFDLFQFNHFFIQLTKCWEKLSKRRSLHTNLSRRWSWTRMEVL